MAWPPLPSRWFLTLFATLAEPQAKAPVPFDTRPPDEVRLGEAQRDAEVDEEGATVTLGGNQADTLEQMVGRPVVRRAEAYLRAVGKIGPLGHRRAPLALRLTGVTASEDGETVYFVQTAGGVRIEGTYGVCVVRQNRVVFAKHLLVRPPSLPVVPHVAPTEALSQILRALPTGELAPIEPDGARPELVIVYAAQPDARGRVPRLAWHTEVILSAAHDRLDVYSDASVGGLLGTESLSHAAVSGQVTMPVEPFCHGEPSVALPMPYAEFAPGIFADAEGQFYVEREPSQARVSLQSPFVHIIDHQSAPLAPFILPLMPEGYNDLYIKDAPLSLTGPFYHVHQVRAWARRLAPEGSAQQRFLDSQLDVHVNLGGEGCDAYYNGSLNFLAANNGCLNTGRTAGIIYHEYGHGLHAHSHPAGMPSHYDAQVSEGVGDYIAATVTGSPHMRGLTSCQEAFRSCVNDLSWCESGSCDFDATSEEHQAGQVLCAAFWELRGLLQKRLGAAEGRRVSDRLHLRFLTLVGGMGSAYRAAIAADDDDDGDPTNGTLHSCEINRAFAGQGTLRPAHFPGLTHLVPCRPTLR